MTEENKNINDNENEDKKHDPDNIIDLASATIAANERAAKFTEQQVNLKYDTGMKPSEKTGYVRTRPDLEVNYWAVEILDAAGQNQIVPLFLQGREFENFPTRHYMAANTIWKCWLLAKESSLGFFSVDASAYNFKTSI